MSMNERRPWQWHSCTSFQGYSNLDQNLWMQRKHDGIYKYWIWLVTIASYDDVMCQQMLANGLPFFICQRNSVFLCSACVSIHRNIRNLQPRLIHISNRYILYPAVTYFQTEWKKVFVEKAFPVCIYAINPTSRQANELYTATVCC